MVVPDGDARYAKYRQAPDHVNLTPDQIHRIGVEQVALIEKDMTADAKRLHFPTWKALAAAIEKDPKRHFHSREEILASYRKFIDRMKPQLPKLFGRLPKGDLVVMPVEEFREKEASGAQYNPGTPDGSRPGHVMINTSAPETRKTISTESTAYHEGVPGHHLQGAIAQELEGLPPQRQQAFYTAYVEGWALYSERLGKEIGFYEDPYSDFGRLQDEMLRAIRLVVDTGFHSKKWTRQQVVDYFHAHSAIDEVDVQSETDRYISIPGQALSYKVGQLKILELRERAKKALGPKFDVRKFHDTVLDAGALPLDVMERVWPSGSRGRRPGSATRCRRSRAAQLWPLLSILGDGRTFRSPADAGKFRPPAGSAPKLRWRVARNGTDRPDIGHSKTHTSLEGNHEPRPASSACRLLVLPSNDAHRPVPTFTTRGS